jgi:hypothetical protein
MSRNHDLRIHLHRSVHAHTRTVDADIGDECNVRSTRRSTARNADFCTAEQRVQMFYDGLAQVRLHYSTSSTFGKNIHPTHMKNQRDSTSQRVSSSQREELLCANALFVHDVPRRVAEHSQELARRFAELRSAQKVTGEMLASLNTTLQRIDADAEELKRGVASVYTSRIWRTLVSGGALVEALKKNCLAHTLPAPSLPATFDRRSRTMMPL